MDTYEKKYKEALLKATAARQNTESAVTIGIIEEIFPELCESEDEKIRKKLIGFVENWEKYNPNSPFNDYAIYTSDSDECDKILAWLEKQGEPTEINPSEFDLRLNKLLKQFESLPKKELISNLRYYLNVIQNDGTYKIEKQSEQEPFDYKNVNIQQKDFASKEVIPRYNIGDVLCDKSCTTLNKEEQPNFEITDIRNGMYICDKGSFPISQQDEYELVAKRIEQKPTWSENEMKMLDNLITYLNGSKGLLKETKSIYTDWLESIKGRVQPKQEWSEEEEFRINRIVACLENLNVADNDILLKDVDWLNSLKERIGG